MDITRNQIMQLCPRARKDYVDALLGLEDWLDRQGILDTPRRWCHFFAQIAHEAGGLTIREEKLSYRAKRICEVWRRRFGSVAEAEPYAHNPAKLANKVYGGRMGNNADGDGWLYRGRGLMQITGRHEYRRVGNLLGVDLESDPDRALDGEIAVRAAAVLFIDYGCLPLADKNDIVAITKRINGGRNGLQDRRDWYHKASLVWHEKTPRNSEADIRAEEDKPAPESMAESTTGNAAIGTGTGGTVMIGTEVAKAFDKLWTAGKGVGASDFLTALATSPTFWIALITVALSAYIWLERRDKLVRLGV